MIKNYAKFTEAPLTAVKPEGWLRALLVKQQKGLTGHIEAAGAPFDRLSWGKTDAENAEANGGNAPGWWSFEQIAYHLDGALRLSILLRDRAMRNKQRAILDAVLSRADVDGYLGPKNLKESTGWNRWPHVVFFRALLAEYAASGDRRITDALREHYLGSTCAHDRFRDVINVEPMLLTYLATGDRRLLSMAQECFASYNAACADDNCAAAQLSKRKAYAHGVTYNEYAKLGALLYVCTGRKEYLKPSVNAYRKIDRYQMLPDGLHCSNEFLLDDDYMQSHETCDISDYTWALGYLLTATGDGSYGDRIERCVFNAGMGSVEEDFKALQYFSCVNQTILDGTSNHNDFFRGSAWMSFRPNPGTECCAGNVHRFLPNYCARMWMRRGRAVAAALYGPSTFSLGSRGEGIVEETRYPFEDEIVFTFRIKKERTFPFLLRIPGWCEAPEIRVGGKKIAFEIKNGFATVRRLWKNGDVVTLRLPDKPVFVRHGDGVYVRRGALVFACGMKGKRSVAKDAQILDPAFPPLDIRPDKPFNYALDTSVPPVFRRTSSRGDPFTIEGACCFVTVTARRAPSWKITEKKQVKAVENLYERPWKRISKTGTFTFTPRYPGKEALKKEAFGQPERITLIPYAAAKLRVTVFPEVPLSGEERHE